MMWMIVIVLLGQSEPTEPAPAPESSVEPATPAPAPAAAPAPEPRRKPKPQRCEAPYLAMTCAQRQADLLNRGIAEQAWGAPLLVTGIAGFVVGLVGLGIAFATGRETNPESAWIMAGSGFGTGAVFSLIGGLLFSAGRDNVREAIRQPCAYCGAKAD